MHRYYTGAIPGRGARMSNTLTPATMWKKEAPTKYIVTMEFRYMDEPSEYRGASRSITATIGIFDTKEEAAAAGNEAIKQAGEDFVSSIDSSGYVKRDRLDPRSPYGSLVRHWHRNRTGGEYFVKFEALRSYQVADILEEVKAAGYRYRMNRTQQEEE